MKLAVTKLDGRHTGNRHFKYMVQPNYEVDNHKLFIDMRQWCWDQYGKSCEYRWYNNILAENPEFNRRWAWEVYNYGRQCRIYLNNQEDVNWMILRWG